MFELYVREMNALLGYLATWLPTEGRTLGEVGVISGGRFHRRGTLAELLGFETPGEAGSAIAELNLSSKNGVELKLNAEASAGIVGSASIEVAFSRQGAFVFQAKGLQEQRLQNQMKINEAVLAAYRAGRWQPDWVFIESAFTARKATILVSQDSNAGLVLSAKGRGTITALALADPKVDLSLRSSRGQVLQILGSEGLQPLYSCRRIRRNWLGTPSITQERVRDIGDGEALERVGVEDLLKA